jgi:hypothetical protein
MGLVVATQALKLEGALTSWARESEQGNTNTRYSCASCGNIIYGIGDTIPDLAKLQAGTLEDTSAVEPEVHIWTITKQPWLVLPEFVHKFETQPNDGLALFQAAMDYRTRA